MPNILDANGLRLATRDEWVEFFTDAYRRIYGDDINLQSNTPDGQMMNINIQVVMDLQDLISRVYSGFDPDQAVGVIQDQRFAINGIQRQGGTYSLTDITLVNTESVNLFGLDGATLVQDVRDDGEDIYTIQDSEGNRWFLVETQLGLPSGSHVLQFRAAIPGEQLTIPNTIDIPSTIVIGVESVNNPTVLTVVGENEETDPEFRLRRQRSVALPSQGIRDGLQAALENVSGVTSAFVYENHTDATDADGVPSHSIWVIVAGNGAPEDIADAIYKKRNLGCGMRGDETYTIIQRDKVPFIVQWDNVITRPLFIKLELTPINPSVAPAVGIIREELPRRLKPGVFDTVDVNEVATIVQQIDPNALVSCSGLSNANLQIFTTSATPASGTLRIKYGTSVSAPMDWDDNEFMVQNIIRATSPELSAVVVTGRWLTGTVTVDFSSTETAKFLIAITDNSLETSGAAPVSIAADYNFAHLTAPGTKQEQFVVTEPNIYIVPMLLLPAASNTVASGQISFNAYGGYGVYTFALHDDQSGASIEPASGLYVAGSVTGVTDTVSVTDELGNTALATVAVV